MAIRTRRDANRGHVSDFHLGELLPLERALEITDLLGAQRPDLVACTGDVVDLHHDEARPLLDRLVAIGAPMGSVLVPGNHDHLDDIDALVAESEAAGVLVLRDTAAAMTANGARLVVAGIDWDRSARRVHPADRAHMR